MVEIGFRIAHDGVEFTVYEHDDEYFYSAARRRKIKKTDAIIVKAIDCRRALDPAIRF